MGFLMTRLNFHILVTFFTLTMYTKELQNLSCAMSKWLRSRYIYVCITFLAHLSQRLIGELIVYRSSRRLSVRACVRASVRALTLSNMNISATSRPIKMKFYLKHHWGGGKPSVGFDPDRIRTLVSMATDSSHRVIMGKTASSRFLDCF